MSKNVHEWNVICVKRFDYPRPKPVEFQVFSKTQLGAAMKASNKLKNLEPGLMISSIYRLCPDRHKLRS